MADLPKLGETSDPEPAQDRLDAGLAIAFGRSALPASNDWKLSEGPGTVLGPYKLLQQIGEGGMGVVYMAEQEHPVRRRVAFKIIKPGMDSKQVIARFEAERQALAMMDHQNIAKVFDAGTTAGEPGCVSAGRPYFVMELVHGVPITQFCDANQLTPRERLALFVPVCQAIQHAHQKGIIHRDVKPSNVLVTLYDDKPVPKVIDFGVAKAIEQRLTEKTLFTQFGALVGTFEYMSPEQAELNALGVDTRSDIYSLGVLLYELLTGTTPLQRDRLREAALDQVVRLIKEEEPPRPSVRLSSSNNLPKIAAARKTEPAKLSKLVHGEIDWIVMKCLEKDRSRRYETANGLARDIERYLHDEPVEACPPSAGYRLRKFARRYWMPVTVAAAFALLLVAGVVVSTWQAVRAARAQGEAVRQRDLADQEATNARAQAQRADRAAEIAKNNEQLARDAKLMSDRRYYASEMKLASLDAEAGQMGLVLQRLDAHAPQRDSDPDLRGFECYYLQRLSQLDLRTLAGHGNEVWGVAYSPDSRHLASTSEDRTVKIWEAATGKEILSLEGHTGWVYGVTYSPDGRCLASASRDGTVRIWGAATGRELFTLTGHTDQVRAVTYSPDGRRLASASYDRTVKVWDAATGQVTRTLEGHEGWVYGVAYSPDGRCLVSTSDDQTAKVWDPATGQALLTLKGHTGGVWGVAYSPDGRHLASASEDHTVKVWDAATGQECFTLKGHARGVWGVAYSPDGRRLASASDDHTVKVWNAATGQECLTLKGHMLYVHGVAYSPDGRCLASTSADWTVKIWDPHTSQECLTLRGHADKVRSVAYSPDGRHLASASDDHTVKIWDAATGQECRTLRGHRGPVTEVVYSPDGRRLASASMDQTVRLWDAATGQPCLILPNTGGVSDLLGITPALAYSPKGGRLASASYDHTVKVWDTATGQECLTLRNTGAVWALAYSPDGRHLVSGGWPLTVKVWDAATGQECLALKDHWAIWALAYSPDGRHLVTAGWGQAVKVWDAVTGQELLTLRGHADKVRGAAYSPDGRRLASASDDQTVRVWDAATGQALLTLKGHTDEVAVAGDSLFARQLRELTLKWHTDGVAGVAYSPDGRCLASASWDHTVKVWDATAITPQRLVEREARGLVQFQVTKPLSPDEMSAAIRRDPTITERVRQQALTWMEPFRRNHIRCLVESLFAKAMLRAEVLAALRADASLHDVVRDEALTLAKTLPENAYALNEASWLVVRRPGGDAAAYQRALRQVEAACRVDPEDANFLNTLGLAYYRVGKYTEAIAALEKCLPAHTSNGMDAGARYVLAMCHYRLGNAAKAREEFQRAMDSAQRNLTRLPEARYTPWLRTETEILLEKPADASGKTKKQLAAIVNIADGAKYVKLVHEDTGKVLAIADNSAQALAKAILAETRDPPEEKAILAEDHGSKAQQWKFEKVGDYYKIVNRKSGKVLDVQANRMEQDVPIIEWNDAGFDNQQWSWEGNDKVGRLKSKSSTLVLDVGDDGRVIQRKADDKAKGQLWRVVAIKE